jgi:hypothetical protein
MICEKPRHRCREVHPAASGGQSSIYVGEPRVLPGCKEMASRPLQKKTARVAPLLHWVQFRRTINSNGKTKAVAERFSSCGTCCLVSPLAPPCGCFICGGSGCTSGGGYSGIMYYVLCVMCYGYTAKWYGRSGFAVGCLPAPLPPEKRRDFPPAPLTLAGQCRYRLCPRAPHGAFLRCRSAGHFARAYVTGCKSTIGEYHGKTKAACRVLC